jgi:predicted ArsR family transcriptional regulator
VAADPNTDVRDFVQQHVESYEQLEVLLLLCRKRDVSWTAATVGEALRISTLMAAKALDDLCREKLVDHLQVGRQTSYTFRPASSRLASTIELLLKQYDDNPLDVIHLMNEKAMDRVRSAAARTFADAFVLEPKKGK